MNFLKSLNAPAKLNIFLKITGKITDGANAGYHELSSRFVRFDGLFDEVYIIERKDDVGLIFDDKIEDNIINKVYNALAKNGFENALKSYFADKQVYINKSIPSGAGLGGGSSDAGAFLLLMRDILGFDNVFLKKISAQIGADVSFFTSELKAANVRGFGQIVESFDDEIPALGVVLSDVFCSTPEVYKAYAKVNFIKDINLAKKLEKMSSKDILASYENFILNDLLASVIAIYAGFHIKENEFLSGSGSAKFKVLA